MDYRISFKTDAHENIYVYIKVKVAFVLMFLSRHTDLQCFGADGSMGFGEDGQQCSRRRFHSGVDKKENGGTVLQKGHNLFNFMVI